MSEARADDMAERIEELARMRDESLNPVLLPYVEAHPDFGRMLRHPLVYSVPLGLPGMVNKMYERKIKALDKALVGRDWRTVVWLHERPYRLYALTTYVTGHDLEGGLIPLVEHSADVRDLAADVWVDSENIAPNKDEWARLFSGWAPGDALLLGDRDERDAFDSLGPRLVIYRGDCDDGGWSWTTDPKVAHKFAHRFDQKDPVLTGWVYKHEVFGYLTRRGESEVLVDPARVRDVREIR